MTSMTSCIVGKKIGAMGRGPLELFPFFLIFLYAYLLLQIKHHLIQLVNQTSISTM